MERQYAPYPKWFGSAFKQLNCAPELTPMLWRTQQASTWQERGTALGEARFYQARCHNYLGITKALPETLSSFFGRPFQVIWGGQFAEEICKQIGDPEIQRIAQKGLIGSIN